MHRSNRVKPVEDTAQHQDRIANSRTRLCEEQNDTAYQITACRESISCMQAYCITEGVRQDKHLERNSVKKAFSATRDCTAVTAMQGLCRQAHLHHS